MPNTAHAPLRAGVMPDVRSIREHARQSVSDGAVTLDYPLDRAQAIALLNAALATELVCVMRYRQHHFVARGLNSEPVAAEFLAHSNEELGHADLLSRRIVQLGGTPDWAPDSLEDRSHAEYRTASDLETLIRENLIAERIAVESYRAMVHFFGDQDSTTRSMLEGILATEEEHADELADLLA
ncbi:ferritin-like domain-containing protein [Niveibacterium sp. SC-1]|uniref:ferritin-like domain-containing protein n=1 Tax=Niveibacterium sp. SC-1 TaxID=3135646 RepID=UPI00311E7D26